MKKPLLIGLFVSLLSPVAWATPIDWSDLFKSWEKGCDTSPALSAFTDSIHTVNTDAKGQFYLEQSIKLPAKYRNQAALKVSFHKMYDEREKYTFNQIRLPLKGQYYGLPAVHYSQTFLLETAGVEYQRLLLDVPIEKARRVLAHKYRPRKHFNLVLQTNETLQAELLSVNINGKSQTVVECRYING